VAITTTNYVRKVAGGSVANAAASAFAAAPGDLGQYNAIVQQILSARDAMTEGGVAVGVTSESRGDGVTTTAANIAVSAAVSHKQTLLLDFNTAHPALSNRLGAGRGPGWSDWLAGESLNDCLRPTTVDDLTLLPARAARSEEAVAFAPKQIVDFIDELRGRFEFIVVDLPPTDDLGTCCHVVSQLDGVLLVLDGQRATHRDVGRARNALERVQAHLLGAVLNRPQSGLPRWLGGSR
jgi:Mrp family chromosome partitioning ATPase